MAKLRCSAVLYALSWASLFPGGGLLLVQGSEAQVGLDDAEVGEELLGLVVADGGVDDDIVAWDPVDGGGDPVLVASLQGVDDTQDLLGVATGRGGVGQDGADGLLGVDDEDGADGESDALRVDVGGVLVVKPVCIDSSQSRTVRYRYHRWVRSGSGERTCRRGRRPSSPCRR